MAAIAESDASDEVKDDADDGNQSDAEPVKEPEGYAYRTDKLE